MKDVDMRLYEAFQKNKNTMCRNDLYYAFLDWADQHPELHQEEIKKAEKFLVSYYFEDKFYEKFFTAENYLNPWLSARTFIDEMLKKYSNFKYQFEMLPNPYRTGEDRMGKILRTNME